MALLPGADPRTGLQEDLPSELHDQAGFLGQGDEHRGRHEAAAGMGPAGQGLDSDDPLDLEVDDRLEVRPRCCPGVDRLGGDRLRARCGRGGFRTCRARIRRCSPCRRSWPGTWRHRRCAARHRRRYQSGLAMAIADAGADWDARVWATVNGGPERPPVSGPLSVVRRPDPRCARAARRTRHHPGGPRCRPPRTEPVSRPATSTSSRSPAA